MIWNILTTRSAIELISNNLSLALCAKDVISVRSMAVFDIFGCASVSVTSSSMMLIHHCFSRSIALSFTITVLRLDIQQIYNCFVLICVNRLIPWIHWIVLVLLIGLVVVSLVIIKVIGLGTLIKGFSWLHSVVNFSHSSLVYNICICLSHCHIKLNLKIF